MRTSAIAHTYAFMTVSPYEAPPSGGGGVYHLSIPKTSSVTDPSPDQRHADRVTGIHPSGQKRTVPANGIGWASRRMPSLPGRTAYRPRIGSPALACLDSGSPRVATIETVKGGGTPRRGAGRSKRAAPRVDPRENGRLWRPWWGLASGVFSRKTGGVLGIWISGWRSDVGCWSRG